MCLIRRDTVNEIASRSFRVGHVFAFSHGNPVATLRISVRAQRKPLKHFCVTQVLKFDRINMLSLRCADTKKYK